MQAAQEEGRSLKYDIDRRKSQLHQTANEFTCNSFLEVPRFARHFQKLNKKLRLTA
jgi:hypothetical protein